MKRKDEEFLKRLRATFRAEAEERLRAVSIGLVDLEKSSSPARRTEILEAIFREAHSLKGAARSVSLDDVEAVCQSMETVFAALKRGETEPSAELFDTLHKSVAAIEKFLFPAGTISDSQASKLTQALPKTETGKHKKIPPPVDQLADPSNVPTIDAPQTAPPKFETPATETLQQRADRAAENVRVSAAKLDSLLLQAEELLHAKLLAEERATELAEIANNLENNRKELARLFPQARAAYESMENHSAFQISSERAKLIELFEWNEQTMKSLEEKVAVFAKAAERDRRLVGGLVDGLLDDMKKAAMLPFSSLIELFPKLVRDLGRDQGKEIEFFVSGAETQIDKRILEQIKDPLIHLLRNAIDHGVEMPAERIRKGKSDRAFVSIQILQTSDKLEITISDDGSGIDPSKVKASAVKRGVISEKEAGKLTEQEAIMLIFESDVSTSPIVSDISGRGLGLAIAKESIERLGGAISVDSAPNSGTIFRLVLPLTLSTYRGILIEVSGRSFIIPTMAVEKAVIIKREAIKPVDGKETFLLECRPTLLVRLSDLLGLAPSGKDEESALALTIKAGEIQIAFCIDEIKREQEILVKSLGKQLSRVRCITGAAITGTGKVVPILNVSDLIKAAVKSTPASLQAKEERVEKRSILVAEDSITSRTLLKNILESAGYNVQTAIDGAEAFAALAVGEFDLLVSDIEMPRMNGFELTAKTRSHKRLAELPVVLVTSLGSREDKERGIEVGANAYIVKGDFEQSNLLDIVRKLIR